MRPGYCRAQQEAPEIIQPQNSFDSDRPTTAKQYALNQSSLVTVLSSVLQSQQ